MKTTTKNIDKLSCLIAVMAFLFIIESFAQSKEKKDKFDGLETVVGNWTVKVEARLSVNGPWETSMGSSVISRVVDGNIIDENFTGTRMEKSFIAKSLLAVNNLNGKLQRVFMDSGHGGMVDFEGQKEDEHNFVFDKTLTYPNGNSVKLRIVYTILSENKFSVESMRMPHPNGT
jgi:hypothetical protein